MPKFTCAACAAARILCANCAAAPKAPFDGLPIFPDAAHAMLPGARQMMSGDDDDDDEDEEDEKPTKGKRKGDDDDDDDDKGKRKRKGDDDDDDDDDRRKKKAKGGMGIGMILGIVAVLLFCCICLPGVGVVIVGLSGVRSAAAQTQSTNNLKQIGLACHSFHDANKRLPFNGSDAPSAIGNVNVKYSKKANANEFTSGSWAFQILPYIDQGPMFNSVNTTMEVKAYMCPGRGRPAMEAGKGAWTDYFINGYVNNPDQAANPAAADMKRTLVGITDGTSNTVLVGHGFIDTGDYSKSANVPGSSNIFMGGTMGTMRSGNSGLANPTGVTLAKDSNLAAPLIGSWGGPFQQGALMAMGDATVRRFPYTTANFGAFLTPFGGEVVTLPDT